MKRYRRLRPRRFRQATYLAPQRMMEYSPPRRRIFPIYGLVGLLVILLGLAAFVFLV